MLQQDLRTPACSERRSALTTNYKGKNRHYEALRDPTAEVLICVSGQGCPSHPPSVYPPLVPPQAGGKASRGREARAMNALLQTELRKSYSIK